MLVVDDNATTREILANELTPLDVTVTTAADGPAAINLLRAGLIHGACYDVALLDMDMPGMGGIELAHAIRNDPALASTSLVLLTSAGFSCSAEAQRDGVCAYLAKPVRRSQLHSTVATVTGRHAGDLPIPPPCAATGRAGPRPRLLIADDNMINQKVALSMLAKMGYEADVVANGSEAVQAFLRSRYGAVLMDWQMPVMDGHVATGEIRQLEQGTAHIPIIAMTASAMKGDREACLDAGMDDDLSKPVKMGDLVAMLSRWLEGQDEARRPDGPDQAERASS